MFWIFSDKKLFDKTLGRVFGGDVGVGQRFTFLEV